MVGRLPKRAHAQNDALLNAEIETESAMEMLLAAAFAYGSDRARRRSSSKSSRLLMQTARNYARACRKESAAERALEAAVAGKRGGR